MYISIPSVENEIRNFSIERTVYVEEYGRGSERGPPSRPEGKKRGRGPIDTDGGRTSDGALHPDLSQTQLDGTMKPILMIRWK